MRNLLSAVAIALLIASCGGTTTAGDSTKASESSAAPAALAASPSVASSAANSAPGLNGRSAELLNPDSSTVVLLYYDLAGLTPPLDNWVEEDNRVKWAQGADKASMRKAVRAELESAAAAVRGIGSIRLSMNANLSEYDPTYGEFAVRALAPSSVISFDALGQDVTLKFGNARSAHIWRVAPAEAQAIRDKIGYINNVSLDALLRITGVQPAPGGGTIMTDDLEYEMQTTSGGLTIARVQVAQN